jgi:ferredoxin-NADP reductase
MNGKIVSIREVAKDIREFKIQLDQPIRFIAGQYMMLMFEDKSKFRKAYSVSTYNAMDKTITLYIKLAGEFTHKLFSLKILDNLFVYGPYGKFILRQNRKLMFIAGGIGIVPLYSMINSLVNGQGFNDLRVYYACRYENEMALRSELEYLNKNNIHVKLYFTREGSKERFKIEDVTSVKGFLDYDYFVCGPEVMMSELVSELKIIGVPEEHIYKESFIMKSHS